MKWIILLVLSLCSFLAQAGNCDVTPDVKSLTIEASGHYTFKPLAASGELNVRSSDIQAEGFHFICNSTQNVSVSVRLISSPETAYYVTVGNKTYTLDFYLDTGKLNALGEGNIEKNKDYYLSDIFNSVIGIHYVIQEGAATGKPITPGVAFPLVYSMRFEYCKGNQDCHVITINYIFNVTLQVNMMTCGFNVPNRLIDTGDHSYFDIKEDRTEYRRASVNIDCSQDESAVFELTPGKIDYYFVAASGFAGNSKILKNDDQDAATGAGEVGFHLQDKNGQEIQYGSGFLYQTDREAQHGDSNPIELLVRPMKYGENIRGGTMKSRVIIVVNNN
jgi:type 1 fimbria pilin